MILNLKIMESFYAPLIYFLYLCIKRTPTLIYPIYRHKILFQPMHAFIRKYITYWFSGITTRNYSVYWAPLGVLGHINRNNILHKNLEDPCKFCCGFVTADAIDITVADKCYTVYRCTLPACNDYCIKLGVHNPQVTCKLSFPPSDYYDTCCCGTWDDKSVGARRLLSRWHYKLAVPPRAMRGHHPRSLIIKEKKKHDWKQHSLQQCYTTTTRSEKEYHDRISRCSKFWLM